MLDHFALTYNVSATGYDYMVTAENLSLMNFTAKLDPQWGHMITSINNIPQTSKYYWGLSVNKQESQVGIDSVKLNVGDDLEWTYTAI